MFYCGLLTFRRRVAVANFRSHVNPDVVIPLNKSPSIWAHLLRWRLQRVGQTFASLIMECVRRLQTGEGTPRYGGEGFL